MSIAYEINRLQTSKADTKEQVNIDKDYINAGIDFIGSETVDDYDEKIQEMQEAYKAFIPVSTTSDTQIDAPKGGIIIGKALKGNTSQSGTPTPSSPVPVNNVTGEQVVRVCGKNLFNKTTETENSIVNSVGTLSPNNDYNSSDYIIVKPSTSVVLSVDTSSAILEIVEYDKSKNLINRGVKTNSTYYNLTTNASTSYIRVSYQNNATKVLFEYGSTATSYEPYQGKDYEINLGKNLANPSDFKFYTQTNASCSYDYDTNTLTMTTLREVTSNELFFCSKIDDNLLKDGKTYTLSNVNVSGVVTSLKLQLRNKNGTNANKPQGTSITYDNNYSLFIVGNLFASSGSTVVPQGTIAVIKDIQVEEGSSASDFTHYYEPIELNKIGNYQDFIRKGTGKNLFDKNTFHIGNISGEQYDTNIRITSWQPLLLEKGTYTFSWNATSPFRFALQGQTVQAPPVYPYPPLPFNTGWQNASVKTYTFTLSQTIWIDVCISKENNANLTLDEIKDFNYQIEKGTTATYYEPYGYKDKWYIEKNVGKKTLNGTENGWGRSGASSDSVFVGSISTQASGVEIATKQGTNTSWLCDKFSYGGLGVLNKFNAYNPNDTWGYGNVAFGIDSTIANDINSFKTWLGSNNITFYYVMKEATYTLIENEDLIEQLEEFIPLLEGQNNISVDGSIPVYMDLDYIVKADKYLIGNRREGK